MSLVRTSDFLDLRIFYCGSCRNTIVNRVMHYNPKFGTFFHYEKQSCAFDDALKREPGQFYQLVTRSEAIQLRQGKFERGENPFGSSK